MAPPWMPPKGTGRNQKYLDLRGCERLDPRAVYGRALNELDAREYAEWLGYIYLRNAEEVQASESVPKPRKGRRGRIQ